MTKTKETKEHTHKHASEERTPRGGLKVAYCILLVAQAVTNGLLLTALAKLNLLQSWQFFAVLIVLIGIFCFNLYKLVISKCAGLIVKIVCAIIAIALIVAGSFGYKYARQTINFVEQVTGAHYETQTYQVRVLKNSSYKDVSQLSRQHIGLLNTNPNLSNTQKALKNAVDFKAKEYSEIGSMIAAIYDFDVAAIVINQSYLDFLEEADNKFVDESTSIYEFEVRMDAPDNRKPVNVTTEPFILYISGSDSRGAITETARSDVNILAVVNPKDFKILLVSIPRDYYVQLHGTTGTKDKLTHAGIYGIDMSKTTIEDLLNIKINYTIKVGFTTLTKVVDAVDGIDIYSDTAFKRGNCTFVQGDQHLNSECALLYARERYSYSSGDRHRGQNQQQIITALIAKISDPHYLVRYSKILESAQDSFESSLSFDEITSFARYQLSELRTWKVESISLDGTGAMMPTYSMGAQLLYVMQPNANTITNAQKKINDYLTTK
ncbi:MAG: LCP family protein [Candidatus Saccharibacteria bacterium]|nr:LCP family protein [Candidatus Saccharibacteria bacterium]